MRQSQKTNHFLWSLTFVILLVGLVILISASSVVGEQTYGDVFYFVKRQLFQGVFLGLLLAWLMSKIDYHKLKKGALILLGLNVLFVLLGFIPALQLPGATSQRWLKIGALSVQPSEFLKLTFIIFLSALLTKFSLLERKRIWGKPFIFYVLSLGLIAFILIEQPSTGTLIVLGLASLLVYFISGMSGRQILVVALVGVMGFSLLMAQGGYRKERIKSFLAAQDDPMGKGYQISQSLIGIGSGGLWGIGFGRSVQKFNYLPQSHSDAIFSIIAEELGFIGAGCIIILYILFLSVGVKIARGSPDSFGKFLAVGLTANIIIQALINIGAMCKLLPITGIPLPFISYGGSALTTNLISIGILSNIAKQS